MPPWQSPLWQSAVAAQPWPVKQVWPSPSHSGPPQSTPVSWPFCTPSLQVAGEQVWVGPHTWSTQSVSTRHFFPSAQPAHTPPPQSTSVSLPSWLPSAHDATTQAPAPSQSVPPLSVQGVPLGASLATQALLVQVLVAQTVVDTGQSLGARQATQAPLPSQTLPPSSLHAEPAPAFAVPQHPPTSQVSLAHSVVGAAQSLGLTQGRLPSQEVDVPPVPPALPLELAAGPPLPVAVTAPPVLDVVVPSTVTVGAQPVAAASEPAVTRQTVSKIEVSFIPRPFGVTRGAGARPVTVARNGARLQSGPRDGHAVAAPFPGRRSLFGSRRSQFRSRRSLFSTNGSMNTVTGFQSLTWYGLTETAPSTFVQGTAGIDPRSVREPTAGGRVPRAAAARQGVQPDFLLGECPSP